MDLRDLRSGRQCSGAPVVFCDRAGDLNHREGPGVAAPQPNFGISPAKAQRPQSSEIKGENDLQTFFTFSHNLSAFAPWREKISDSDCIQIADHLRRLHKF
jgi:hypothetical protein